MATTKSAKTFKDKLNQLVEKEGWTQTEFGDRIGVSHPQARKYLRGESSPPFEMLDNIANAFGIPVSELFLEKEKYKPNPPHTLNDCMDAVTAAISNAKGYEPSVKRTNKILPPEYYRYMQEMGELNPLEEEILSLLSSLDEGQREALLMQVRDIVQLSARSIGTKEKKIK